MTTSKPPTTKSKPVIPKTKPIAAPKSHTPKTFSVKPWTDEDEGDKIIIYGKSGIGKTTLAAMADNSIFIGLDDGGRKIRNPKTNEPIAAISGIETYQDVRDALHQKDLFEPGQSVVIDTGTKLEELASTHIVETVPYQGNKVTSFRKYGWDGDRYLLDHYRLILTDLDALVRKGTNVIILAQLAQVTIANAEGVDYFEDGPKLQHRKDCSVRTEVIEWADHVIRLGYLDFEAKKDDVKAKAGKVVSNDATRAVFTGGAQHFIAKSRPVLKNRSEPYRIPPVISFADVDDSSLWDYLWHGAIEASE